MVTILITTSKSERCFSTPKLLKTHLRNTKSEGKQTALFAMLSNEKSMAREIPNINGKVIEKFIRQK